MKALKFIIPAVIVIIIVVGVWVLISSHHRDQIAQLRQMIYKGDTRGLDEFLSKHRSLANADNVDTEGKGWTPLHLAAYTGNPAIIKVLLDHHAKTEARDKSGLTPLHWTAFGSKPAAAEALIAGGADINAKGRDGRTTMEQSKIALNQEMIAVLREHGAKE